MNTTEKFDLWCVVELFGHAKIAGRCTEQNIAGGSMLRVDVPETKDQPAFTRFFGNSAIYAINPVDEQTARFMAEKIQVKPIDSWNISELQKKHQAMIMAAPTKEDVEFIHGEELQPPVGRYGTTKCEPFMIDGEEIDILDPRHPDCPF